MHSTKENHYREAKGFICELCQRLYSSEESFLEHLSEHSKEEIEALKKLAELSLKDEEAYETLCWELIRLEYFERLKEAENVEPEGKE